MISVRIAFCSTFRHIQLLTVWEKRRGRKVEVILYLSSGGGREGEGEERKGKTEGEMEIKAGRRGAGGKGTAVLRVHFF